VSTFVYVDGFNLYNRALTGTPFKWLDLPALCNRVLGHRVEHVPYFTARIIARQDDPQQPQRQQAYLRDIGLDPRLTIHYGSFKRRGETGRDCKSLLCQAAWVVASGFPLVAVPARASLWRAR
jgi:hypothetical protein